MADLSCSFLSPMPGKLVHHVWEHGQPRAFTRMHSLQREGNPYLLPRSTLSAGILLVLQQMLSNAFEVSSQIQALIYLVLLVIVLPKVQ